MRAVTPKTIIWLVLAIEISVLIITISGYAISKKGNPADFDLGIDATKLQSLYIEYDNGWHFNEGISDDIEEPVIVLGGPFSTITKGYYTLVVDYSCDNEQYIELFAEDKKGENSGAIEANPIETDPVLYTLSYDFKVKETVHNFEIRAKYNGSGKFDIYGVSVQRNLIPWKRTIVYCLFALGLTVCMYSGRHWINKHRIELTCLFFIAFISSLPLFIPGLDRGAHDLEFHLMRIEGISSEIRSGNIPVRMQSEWIGGNGYPVSIFYGDVLLYIPALLRLAGFTVSEAYKVYVILINLMTVTFSFLSFRLMIRDKLISIVMTMAYATATYRLINIYTRAAVGEFTAMTFYPLIVYALYLLYDENKQCQDLTDSYIEIKAGLILAVSMTGILCSHILSAEMTVLSLIIYCLINLRKTIRKKNLFALAFASLCTICLSMYFIVPFMDYFKNVDVVVTHATNMHSRIQRYGIYILQLFTFFQNPHGYSSLLVNERFALTPGALLMTGLLVAIMLCISGKTNANIKKMTTFSLLMIIISTNVFPWDLLSLFSKIGNVLTQVQFPWRFLSIACIGLSVLLGVVILEIVNRNKEKKILILYSAVLISFFSTIVFFSQYVGGIEEVNFFCGADISQYAYGKGEYLRVKANGDPVLRWKSNDHMFSVPHGEGVDVQMLSRKGASLRAFCETDSASGTLILPLFNYKGYTVTDNTGAVFEIKDDEYCRISVDLPCEYSNTIQVLFQEPWYWRVAEMVSLCSWVLIGCYFINGKRKSIVEE